jgi:hypothetical protein
MVREPTNRKNIIHIIRFSVKKKIIFLLKFFNDNISYYGALYIVIYRYISPYVYYVSTHF